MCLSDVVGGIATGVPRFGFPIIRAVCVNPFTRKQLTRWGDTSPTSSIRLVVRIRILVDSCGQISNKDLYNSIYRRRPVSDGPERAISILGASSVAPIQLKCPYWRSVVVFQIGLNFLLPRPGLDGTLCLL